jgi:hypothetical protein
VVGQVGDDVVWRLDEVDEVLIERVTLDEAEGRDIREPLAQEGRQRAVELDGGDVGAGRQQARGQKPQTGPDLEHAAAGRRIRLGQDGIEHVRVGQEVLGE